LSELDEPLRSKGKQRGETLALEVPRSSLRDALVRSGFDLRPQGKWQNGHVRGVPPYGYVVVGGKLVENP